MLTPITDKTPAEILTGVLDIIQNNDYLLGISHTDNAYSLAAAFDQVVFDDADYTNDHFLQLIAGNVAMYPDAYLDAKEAMHDAAPNREYPLTKEEAITVIQDGIAHLSQAAA